MGERSYLVDLDEGIKIYLHWGAAAVRDADNINEVKEILKTHLEGNAGMQKMFQGISKGANQNSEKNNKESENQLSIAVNPHATGKYSIEEHNIEKYSDEDAIEDLDLWIEGVYVFENDEVKRAYTWERMHYDARKDPEPVIFKMDDKDSLKAFQETKSKLYNYMKAYCFNDMKNPAEKALTHALKREYNKGINTRLNILYSTVTPEEPEIEKMIQKIGSKDPIKTEIQQDNNQKKEEKEKAKTSQTTLKNIFQDPEKRMAEKKRKRKAKREVMDIEEKKDGKYEVKGKYTVNMANRSCTCPDYMFRELKCKHIHKVESYLEEKREK